MTPRTLANSLLRWKGVYTLDPAQNGNELNQQGFSGNDLADVTDCINAGLQDWYTLAPAELVSQKVASQLYAPAQISISGTQFSNSVAIASGWLNWMLGCTVSIAGDGRDNEFVSGGGITALSVTGGSGYTAAPTISFPGGDGNAAAAVTLNSGSVVVTLTNGGNGYVSGSATLSGGVTSGSAASVSFTASTTFNFLRPFQGDTNAACAATVYCDAVALAANVQMIVEPVATNINPGLHGASSEQEFNGWHRHTSYTGYRQWAGGGTFGYFTINKPIGQPWCYYADCDQGVLANSPPQRYLRISPKPGAAMSITYRQRLRPRPVQQSDIWLEATPTADPGLPFPLDLMESTLLPFCLRHWMATPHFAPTPEQRATIEQQYKDAYTKLMPKQKAKSGPERAVYADAGPRGSFMGYPLGRL